MSLCASPTNPGPHTLTPPPLKDPAFVSFVLARMLAMFAQQMQAVVVAWQVYDITRETL